MPRLFVAIDLPERVKSALLALKTDIPTARWSKAQNMHLTLRFIGADVPDDSVEPIKMALKTVEAAPFDLQIGGVGRFPPSTKKAPRVLWVGVDGGEGLRALHGRVETALATVGFPPEKRDFKPHITLARLKTHKPTPEADAFLQTQADFSAGTVAVKAFKLYQSTLTPQGARYTILATIRMAN